MTERKQVCLDGRKARQRASNNTSHQADRAASLLASMMTSLPFDGTTASWPVNMKMCWQAVMQDGLLYGLQVSRMSCQQASSQKSARTAGMNASLLA